MDSEALRRPQPRFFNHPPKRLFLEQERAAFRGALETTRASFGREYRLRLGGAERETGERVAVPNPSNPDGPPVGYVYNAGAEEISAAIELAGSAVSDWAARTIAERGGVLRRAAVRLAERRDEIAAWAVHEAAKAWTEAFGDVDEAIDYLNFYAQAAETLAADWLDFRPRGVVAVIPPWNFPVAIPCGMTSAALVTGNCVILKPAEQTPIVAFYLVQILHESGVPEDALIWLPGRGELSGAGLVGSSDVDMVAFTGSRAVGTSIYRQGAQMVPRRGGIRTTIAEMGGKNPIVVLPDADLDEAVIGILRSAFGHANQKCSAASRVLIHRDVFDRLSRRLAEGARSLAAGSAEDAGAFITPLIDADARERVRAAGERALTEGITLLDDRSQPSAPGVVGPLIVELSASQTATAATAQEEIFGPVLALIPFSSEQEAIAVANNTPYALTAGVFSRSPSAISQLVAGIDAGNVYVNRPTTGARVAVEPFGGHKLSGTGPKAGSVEYLWAFVRRRNGHRADGLLSNGTEPLPPGSVQPWRGPATVRGRRVRGAVALLRGAWRDRWTRALAAASEGDPGDPLSVVDQLLGRLDEIARPEPTLVLPGQHTTVRWDTPRGCGIVLVDAGSTAASLLALLAASLLTGNGTIVVPDPARRPVAAVFLEALERSGMPSRSAALAGANLDLQSAIALPEISFAAVDAGESLTRSIYRLLAESSATPAAPFLKALITLGDGPGVDQSGFLRRFALPKTVAIRTLHLGAELELPDTADG